MRMAILSLIFASAVVVAQSPATSDDLRYEVASIKRNVRRAKPDRFSRRLT